MPKSSMASSGCRDLIIMIIMIIMVIIIIIIMIMIMMIIIIVMLIPMMIKINTIIISRVAVVFVLS